MLCVWLFLPSINQQDLFYCASYKKLEHAPGISQCFYVCIFGFWENNNCKVVIIISLMHTWCGINNGNKYILCKSNVINKKMLNHFFLNCNQKQEQNKRIKMCYLKKYFVTHLIKCVVTTVLTCGKIYSVTSKLEKKQRNTIKCPLVNKGKETQPKIGTRIILGRWGQPHDIDHIIHQVHTGV